MAKCLRGDTLAFGELSRRYQDRLFNMVYRLLGSVEDAQGVVQETFLNAWKSLHTFKGDAELYTWLHRIAWNTAVSLMRKQRLALSMHAGRTGQGAIDPY